VEVDYTNLDANEIFLLQALETKQVINIKEIEAFIPKKEIIKTINSLIDLRFAQIDEQVSEKYFSKQVAYIKIKDDILEEENLIETLSRLKKSPKQKELLVHILSIYYSDTEKNIRKSEVIEKGVFTNTHLKGLIEKGIVEEFYLQKDRLEGYSGEVEKIEQLTPTQLEAKVKIDLAFAEGKNVLLHGVTSSGKTHIFLDKIDEMVQQDRNVLVLLPEVSITKQITSRLEKKYGGKLGFYHQRLTDFERVEIWKKIRNNELRVVIGTTISIFLPFSNLGLIVVDEEHDAAYKSREITPFFSGKDASLYLSSLYKAKVILSSATPSVESYYLAQIGKLEYVFVGERFGGISVPKIEIVDYKQSVENKDLKSLNFSNRLYDEINTVLERKKQVMLLHNRRGYSNVMECAKCGYVSYCSNCDVILTYHKASHQLKCHYCGNKIAPPVKCPKCSSNEFNMKGIGVEQIYEETKTIFPTAEVDRMDADSMKTKFAYEKLYEKIHSEYIELLESSKEIREIIAFSDVVSGKTENRKSLETYVQGYYLDLILVAGTKRLLQMTNDRYRFIRRDEKSKGGGLQGLEIEIHDIYLNSTRIISSLSGGELFLASLALALGLAEVIQNESGGISLETIFIDEGFGSLDTETLDIALTTLIDLQSYGRNIGIISHVSELKERIRPKVEVYSKDNYAKIKMTGI